MSFLIAHKKWLIACTIISVLGFFPLMGFPGIIFMAVADNYVIPFLTHRPISDHYGDSAWPIAIMYSILMPWGAFLLNVALKASPLKLNGLALTILTLFLALALSLAIHMCFLAPDKI